MGNTRALGAAIGGIFLTQLDVGLVSVALPSIARSYPEDVASAQAVVVAYLAFLALGYVPAGLLADRWSRSATFRLGLIAFAIGSLVSALSPNLGSVLIGRALQGAGAAASVGVGQVLAFGPGVRGGRNLGFAHVAVAAGLVVGAILGGFLLERASWQQLFLLETPLALAVALLASEARSVRMTTGGQALRALLRRELLLGVATAALAFVAMSANMFVIPLFLQGPLTLAPSTAGFLMSIVPVAILFVAPFAGSLADRSGARLPTTLGLALVALGIAAFGAATSVRALVVPALAFYGVGAALFQSPNNRAVLAAAPTSHLALASGLLATSRQIGQIVGVGASATLLRMTPGDTSGAYALTFFAFAGLALVSAGLSAIRAE